MFAGRLRENWGRGCRGISNSNRINIDKDYEKRSVSCRYVIVALSEFLFSATERLASPYRERDSELAR